MVRNIQALRPIDWWVRTALKVESGVGIGEGYQDLPSHGFGEFGGEIEKGRKMNSEVEEKNRGD